MTLDINLVRSQFPSLNSDWVFMDNAGGAQVPRVVVERISDYLLGDNVQLGASYAPSQHARDKVNAGRQAVATLVNARHVEELVFGPSSTIQFRLLADAMTSQFAAGDEIIVTNTDHESHVGPWVRLAERSGATIRFWNCNPQSLELELDDLRGLLTDRTRLVCIAHVSNLLGTINPVKQIATLVHEYGARLCVDGVAFAPHRIIDVQDWDVDYYGFSLYKVFGPHHAVLYAKKECLLELDNIYHHFFTRDQIPGKVEPGNPNYELTYACTGILDYLLGLGAVESDDPRDRLRSTFANIAEHEARLTERLLSYLKTRKGVRIIGRDDADIEHRVSTVSFTVDGRKSDEIVSKVDESMVGIRYGDFYARRLAEDLGLMKINGVVRMSMVHYNNFDEVDRLIKALDDAM
ncbi:cysteine desulfurase-like protein [Halomonas huangheensis]|uniref:Aminotransferase class V domain-containing protein n=1 Tax=Halomonas huangheensis TaxID=1178482 RepID=W1N5R6_9GAMM|nr:cysteine desulfurase-like protein [Halomonas huangheensis]ALM54355.1 aminotransferase [Halomonas huangheensis]ERL50917.1 hypothetical protein BJB45_20185 [Halomonas huangheensis]